MPIELTRCRYYQAKLMILAFEKFEKLPLDTLKQLYYLSKQLKYDLYDIFFEMVRQYDAKPLINRTKSSNRLSIVSKLILKADNKL